MNERAAVCGVGKALGAAMAAFLILVTWSMPAQANDGAAVMHSRGMPAFLTRLQPNEVAVSANAGMLIELDIGAAKSYRDHMRLSRGLEALAPQRPGTIDAYILAIALDSDPVFGREVREAARVLSNRYDAAERTLVLAAPDGNGDDSHARGSPRSLSIALAHIAELMDRSEDVLILYTTSHGMPTGLVYHYGDQGFGSISPLRLSSLLGELGIVNRLLIINACYSGTFVPGLATETSVVVASAAADRTSFGCSAANDWTYFGDAFVNRGLRRPVPLATAFEQAVVKVAQWEGEIGVPPSEPQIGVGVAADRWLEPLEARMPRQSTRPVGRPAANTN